MKRKLLIRCMMAAAALLTVSCTSDDLALEGGSPNKASGEEVEVTFSVSTETAQAVTRATRADETKKKGPGFMQTVGRGSKVDMLIYAVYEKDGDNYVLLKQYGDGKIPSELEDSTAFEDKASHEGQTIVYNPFGMTDIVDGENNSKSHNITLRLMRGKEYCIAFWAQSSRTSAYITSNLEKVQVKYDEAKNNDELRDAFCKVENFTLGADGSSRTVVLTRPLAQINVGTTGADYKRILESRTPNRFVAYSEITLSGVAQYMNVVTDEIIVTEKNADGEEKDLTTTATFTRSVIPAYMNGDLDAFKKAITGTDNDAETDAAAETDNTKEEYLYIDLNGDGKISGYVTEYPTVDATTKQANTETFKYLSMCYVLVPATATSKPNYNATDENTKNADEVDNADDEDKEDDVIDPYTSSTLKSVEIKFAETEAGTIGFPPVKLTWVPVHRNWRTNILGGLYDKKIPNDDEEDPNSVFKLPCILVDKDVTYDGDYHNYPNGDWTENPDQSSKGNAEEGEGDDEEEKNEE